MLNRWDDISFPWFVVADSSARASYSFLVPDSSHIETLISSLAMLYNRISTRFCFFFFSFFFSFFFLFFFFFFQRQYHAQEGIISKWQRLSLLFQWASPKNYKGRMITARVFTLAFLKRAVLCLGRILRTLWSDVQGSCFSWIFFFKSRNYRRDIKGSWALSEGWENNSDVFMAVCRRPGSFDTDDIGSV